MGDFDLREWMSGVLKLPKIPLNELSMERNQLYMILRKFLGQYDALKGTDPFTASEASNLVASQLKDDFSKFDQVQNPKEMSKIIIMMGDEFEGLFEILSQYYDFETDDLGEVVMEFANYVDSQSSKINW